MNYCDSTKLEEYWTKWNTSKDESARELLYGLIYQICEGVAKNFKPHSEDELRELTHEAFVLTISKIQDGRLNFTPGRAPVFNLLTTTIFRQLYSLKNRDSRRKRLYERYRDRIVAGRVKDKHLLEVS
jgi:hypothetical protein